MKSFVLIFTTLLSFIFGGNRASNECDINIHRSDSVVQCSDKDATDKKADVNDVAILPVRTSSYCGDGNDFSPSFRSNNSGRRIQPSTKSAFRVIKAGKIYDRNYFHTFQTILLQFQSGIRSNSRYIYSICQMLI